MFRRMLRRNGSNYKLAQDLLQLCTRHVRRQHSLSDLPVYLGEVGAGPADRGRVDDGGHLVEVVLEDPVEEYLVAVMDGLQHLDKRIWQSFAVLVLSSHLSL